MEPSFLNFDTIDVIPSSAELISIHFRAVAQKPYELPEAAQNLDLTVELTNLSASVRDGQISLEQAVSDFDSLLGLRSNNIRSFEEDFCRDRKDLCEAAHTFLNTVAGVIAKKPFSEADNVSQENNGGMLAAARFLAPYAYAASGDQTVFIPQGEVFFAFQRSNDPLGASSPNCKDSEVRCVGQKIFSALQNQLRRLSDETQVRTFGETASDVEYGAAFSVDRSSGVLQSLPSDSQFTLEAQEMGEQVSEPTALWTSLAQRFGGRAFVSWKIDDVSSSDLPDLQIHNANSWNPTFTSSMVYADAAYPVTLTVDDVYGNEQVFHTTIVVRNNINEAPIAEIDVPRKVAAGEIVTAKIKNITDNPDDKEHKISWKVMLGDQVLAKGEGESIEFKAPNLLDATKVRVIVNVDDGHTDHNIGTKTAVMNVAAAPATPFNEEVKKGNLELAALGTVFKAPPQQLSPDKLAETFAPALVDAFTLDHPVEYADYSLLNDGSGSMSEKLKLLEPYESSLVAGLKSQVTSDGFIRIGFYTYVDEQTNKVGTTGWIPAKALQDKNFMGLLKATIKYIEEHPGTNETAWYTVWDLYEGPHKEAHVKPEGKAGEYEHRMVILTDEGKDDPGNVVSVPTRSQPFDENEAEKFVANHPDASLRIIQISAIALFAGKTDVVSYNPTNDAKFCPTGMSYIPGRTFVRGGDGPAEGPLSLVTLDPYCIDQTEVTNAQYTASGKKSPSREGYNGPKQPVVDINWADSKAYCESQGKHLPTEAQWENVAKGPDGLLLYPTAGGEKPSATNANWASDTVDPEGTSDVASYPVGPFGTYDMAGNVWEWTSDNYAGSYDITQTSNPTGSTEEGTKVLRGGSWDSDGYGLRSSYRSYYDPDSSNDDLGFRCVSAPRTPEK